MWRPRRAAVALSWIALAAAVVGTVGVGILLGVEQAGRPLGGAAVAAGAGVILATVLPRLSGAWSTRAGTVAISPDGVIISGQDGTDRPLVPLGDLRRPGSDREVSRVLPAGSGTGLGRAVRWRPGAWEAIERWATDGFSPTVVETRKFGLDPAWSPDPRAHVPPLAERLRRSVVHAWGSVLLAGFGGIIVWGLATGEASGWMGVVFGWMPVVGLIVLLPKIVTSLRTPRPLAGADEQGWFDILHGRHLIPWERIDRIEVHGRAVIVVLLPHSPRVHDLTYPPSTDTVQLATRVERHGWAQVRREEDAR